MRKSIDEQIKELETRKKKLLKKKVQKNNGNYYKIGQLVEEYSVKGFEGFSLDKFKQEIDVIKGILIEKPVIPAVIPASVSSVI